MEIATFVSLMSEDEKKDCLRLIAKDNLKLFSDVLVEETAKIEAEIENSAKKSAANEENIEKKPKMDGYLGYSEI